MVGSTRNSDSGGMNTSRSSKLSAISALKRTSVSPDLSPPPIKKIKRNNEESEHRFRPCNRNQSIDDAYIDSVRLYQFLRQYEKNSGPVFMQRNLTYRNPANQTSKLNRKRLNKMVQRLHSEQSKRCDVDTDPVEPVFPKHFKIRCIRGPLLTGAYNAHVMVRLSKMSGNQKANVANLAPDGVQINVNNRGEGSKVHLPHKAFTPLNGHKLWTCRLWFRVVLTKVVSPEGKGGKELRSVPQRQAMRASLGKGGLRGHSLSPNKSTNSPGRLETHVYYGQKLIAQASHAEITEQLKGRINVQLMAVPDISPSKEKDNLDKVINVLEYDSEKIKLLLKRASTSTCPSLELDFGSGDEDMESDSDSDGWSSRRTTPVTVQEISDIPHRLVYAFRVTTDNQPSRVLPSIAEKPNCCPFCRRLFNKFCVLMMHLRYTHHRFKFDYQNGETGPVIIVSINDKFRRDFTLEPNRPFQDHSDPFPHPTFVFTEVLYSKRDRACLELNDDFSGPYKTSPTFKSCFRPTIVTTPGAHIPKPKAISPKVHLRQYFHAHSRLKRLPGEDCDSEAEQDPEWAIEDMHRNLYDFTDLNAAEKRMMLEWNKFVMQHQCRMIADREVENTCMSFIKKHAQFLDAAVKDNLVLHIAAMTVSGALTSNAALRVTKYLHAVVQQEMEVVDIE